MRQDIEGVSIAVSVIGSVFSLLLWYAIRVYQKRVEPVPSKFINDKTLIKYMAIANFVYFLVFGFLIEVRLSASANLLPVFGALAYVEAVSMLFSFSLSCIISFNMAYLVYYTKIFEYEQYIYHLYAFCILPILAYTLFCIVGLSQFVENKRNEDKFIDTFRSCEEMYDIFLLILIFFNIVCYCIMINKTSKMRSTNIIQSTSSGFSRGADSGSAGSSRTSMSSQEKSLNTIVARHKWYPIAQVAGRIIPTIVFLIYTNNSDAALVDTDDIGSGSFPVIHIISVLSNLFIPIGFLIALFLVQPKVRLFLREAVGLSTESAKGSGYQTTDSKNITNPVSSVYEHESSGAPAHHSSIAFSSTGTTQSSTMAQSYTGMPSSHTSGRSGSSDKNYLSPLTLGGMSLPRSTSMISRDFENAEDFEIYKILQDNSIGQSFDDHYTAM